MKTILTLVGIVISILVSGQKNPVVLLESNEVSLCKLKNSQELKAIEYSLNMPVISILMDTITRTLGCTHDVILDNGRHNWRKTYLSLIDLDNNTLRWSRIGRSLKGDFRSNGKYLLRTSESDIPITTRINIENGSDLWSVENDVCYMSKKLEIGIGFKTLKATLFLKNDLQGIDMTTGEILWTKKMDLTNGWVQAFIYADTALYAVSDGIHKIDFKNGNGWHVEETITKTSIISSQAHSLNSRNEVKAYFPANKIRNIVSNVRFKNEGIYFASKDNILKVSYDGDILWKSELPEKWTSKSAIWFNDEKGLIYLINFGLANVGIQQVHVGKIFLAAFETATGAQHYLEEIVLGEKLRIKSYDVDEDDDYLYFSEGENIGKIDLSTGKTIKSSQIQPNYTNKVLSYDTFILSDNGSYYQCGIDMVNHIDVRSTLGSNQYWIQLNPDLEEIKRHKTNLFLSLQHEYNDFKLIYDHPNKQYVILNADNFEIGRFKGNLDGSLYDSTFYYTLEGKIYRLNLNQLDNQIWFELH
jgi:hypothetical protein